MQEQCVFSWRRFFPDFPPRQAQKRGGHCSTHIWVSNEYYRNDRTIEVTNESGKTPTRITAIASALTVIFGKIGDKASGRFPRAWTDVSLSGDSTKITLRTIR